MEDDQPTSVVGATPSSNEEAENTENRRLDSWVLLCTLSSITLAAYLTTDLRIILGGIHSDKIFSDQWVISCISISIALATVGAMTTIITTIFLIDALWVKILELILSIISIAAWIIVLIATLDPSYGLSQLYVGQMVSTEYHQEIVYSPNVRNANQYFMSWGSGICAFLIFVDVGIHIYDSKIIKRSQSSSSQHYSSQQEVNNYAVVKKWCLVTVASAVLVTEGINFENEMCVNPFTNDISCRKNQYGFYTGIVGLSIAFIAVFGIILITLFSCLKRESSSQTSSPVEDSSIALGLNLMPSFLMSINYSIAVGMLTFGKGPATYPCNAYFAAWLGFFVSYSVLWALMKKVLSFVTVRVKERKKVAGAANEPNAIPGVSEGENEEEEKVGEGERDEEDNA